MEVQEPTERHETKVQAGLTTKQSPNSRFKWTQEKSQVAFNLVKHGHKPKLISVAVGCSLRTAQKFVEQVTPKTQGETYREFQIKRRGRPSKDINNRLEAIKQVLSNDKKKTQIEIAADLKVSNTTVCRDLKRIGTLWRERSKSAKKTRSRKSNNPKKVNTRSTKRGPKKIKKQPASFEAPIDLDVDVISVEVS